MPTYEYECINCKNRTEVFQSITDPPLQTCEQCGGQLRRVFHPAMVQFKGSGFYSTDNRRAGGSAKPKASEKSDGAAESKSGEKSGDSSKTNSSSSSVKTAEKSA
ncbi:MAG TPA: FmdB family zinc ribbon protein [Actinomycetota bacterium]|nr:FmdB family zinc ribbon protein [Actinomycetota bacterium]